jgi:16S rRNA (guanine(966)-N(2))-methyltransferase RsmD
MRVIAGKARRLPLKTLEGTATRPTQDRIKETLFNMLHSDIPGCRFLDLFAGSGAIGIEALSRGARFACFVEQSPDAVSIIHENLTFTKLQNDALVLSKDVYTAIAQLSASEPAFDIIFMDPPYRMLHEKRVLELLQTSPLVNQDTLIIVEASLDTKMDYINELNFEIVRVKPYKTNQHIFIMQK